MIDNESFYSKVEAVLVPILKEIVDTPDKLTFEVSQGEQTTVFEVKVDRSDLGKVIGKQGRMAQSLRLILHSISAKYKRRAVLEIVE